MKSSYGFPNWRTWASAVLGVIALFFLIYLFIAAPELLCPGLLGDCA